MRTTLLTASFVALLAGQAGAATIGVSMQSFDDNFQTLLRNGITTRAGSWRASMCSSRTRSATSASSSAR